MEPADTSMPKRREKPSASLPRKDRTKKSKDSEKSTDDNSPLIPATQSQTVETEEGVISHHTKKRSKEEKELQEPSENTAKASKKRKRKDIENGPPTPPQSKVNENDGNIEPKRKKRNRTEFTDPRADESLGSQCRKALEYAFTQMNKPSKWKFNKARQNWIIRNVWSPETLPDVYFPLVLKYLSKVQGGSREKLKETAETHLTFTEASPKSDNPSKKVVNFETPPEATLTKMKPSPGPLIVGPTSTSDPSKIVVIDKPNEIIRERARQIMAVLSSSDNA